MPQLDVLCCADSHGRPASLRSGWGMWMGGRGRKWEEKREGNCGQNVKQMKKIN